MRSSLLLLAALFTSVLHAGEVDLYAAPAKTPTTLPNLTPLPKDLTRENWPKHREELQKLWQKELGTWPATKAPLTTRFLEKESLPGFTRQYVQYQIEDGVWTDGYLLQPDPLPAGRLPAIAVFHPTTPLQAKGVAGVSPEYSEEKHQGVHLVQRGYIVWCPRNYLFDDVDTGLKGKPHYIELTQRIKQKHPDWTGLMRMTWEGVRSADFLESLPNVDAARIGCIGHSLGAKVALFSAAFDSRFKATVFSEGGIGLRMSNWNDVWYLGEKIRAPEFTLDNHQVMALIAPRAFLILAGESADTDVCWTYLQAAKPAYTLVDAEKNLAWWNHRKGHAYPPEARAVAEAFLDQHLKK